MTQVNEIKARLKEGEIVEFCNVNDDAIELTQNSKTERFDLWLNGKIIASQKTFGPIVKKLEILGARITNNTTIK